MHDSRLREKFSVVNIREKQGDILDLINHCVVSLKKVRACSQCLKITEKVSFNIESEASYVYLLTGQKLIKMPKMDHFVEFLKSEATVKQCYQTRQL